MKIRDLFPDVIMEDTSHEFKGVLTEENQIKWAKTIISYANGRGGTLFVGVDNNGTALGLDLKTIDEMKRLIALVND